MQNRRTNYLWLVGVVFGLTTAGCGSPAPTAYPADYKAQFEKKHGGDEMKARAFVSTLAGLPAGERRAYLLQHSADARNLGLIPDADLQARYQSLMKAQK